MCVPIDAESKCPENFVQSDIALHMSQRVNTDV